MPSGAGAAEAVGGRSMEARAREPMAQAERVRKERREARVLRVS
jgi:hypothetical protein